MSFPAVVSKLAERLSPWRAHVLPIAVLALGGTALFGVLHALLIEPIWLGLATGLPRAALAGAGMTWCYSQMRSHGRVQPGVGGGLLFGLAVWLGLLPSILVAALQRAAGVRARLGWLEPPLDLLVVAATGAVVGFALTRSRRATVAAAACMAGVLGVLNAPFAIEADRLQRLLFLGFLPIYLAAGTALSWLLRPPSTATASDAVVPPVSRIHRWLKCSSSAHSGYAPP